MMKKKNLKLLKLNKKSISSFSIYGGEPDRSGRYCSLTLETDLECEPTVPPETFARMCGTTIPTTTCPSAYCY